MAATFEEAKKKIQLKKNKIEMQEKKIKEKERKAETQQLIKLGQLVKKAHIDSIDSTPLFGAFLEIKEQAQDSSLISKWENKGLAAQKELSSTDSTPLIITFDSEPSDGVVSTLREYGFKWNRFWKGWYGYGNKQELETVLQKHDPKIETV